MQSLAVAGDFGFSDRQIDGDTIEVTYRGPEISISSRNPREDSRLAAEKLKVRDLALLRGAQLAQERGIGALRIVTERVDSDIDTRSYPDCRPSPFWGPSSYWGPYYGYHHRYSPYGWPGPTYNCYRRDWSKGHATAVLVLDLFAEHDTSDFSQQPVAGTISRLEKTYAGATYP